MTRITLRAQGQITLPEDIRVRAKLEVGDLFEAEITQDGILLRPQRLSTQLKPGFGALNGKQENARQTQTQQQGTGNFLLPENSYCNQSNIE
jgi:bifunctional DNA-binding transcriptional regulator/antitoxin component of YhaV-PrlF toxin-antitoxin module